MTNDNVSPSERLSLLSPNCPTGILVVQRYDKRDAYGIIVKRKWRAKCYLGPVKVTYR